jgi:hypothetical protein
MDPIAPQHRQGKVRASGRRAALFVAVCAAVVTTGAFLGAADAKKKQPSVVGRYKGTTEEGGKVSFKLTSSARIVQFILTNATLYCLGPTHGSKIPTREPDFTKPLDKITHGPMRMKKVSKKFPQGKEFEFRDPFNENVARRIGIFRGKLVDLLPTGPTGVVPPGKRFKGEVEFETANGPTPFPTSQNPAPEWAPGTEWCVTKAIDWTANKAGK